MARIVRRRIRKKRRPTPSSVPVGTLASEPREQSLPSVLLVGGTKFRTLLAPKLAVGRRVRTVAEIDAVTGTLDLTFAPKADVVVAQAGGALSLRNMHAARAVQQKRPGTSVVLVIEQGSREHLAEYWRELSSWSLLTPATAGDPAKLVSVVESTAHGIRWVDPEIGRMLRKFQAAGGPRASAERGVEDVSDFATVRGEWKGRVERAAATGKPGGAWLTQSPEASK